MTRIAEGEGQRLLDAVTVEHGPIAFLARYFLAVDRHMRERGVRLVIRRDMAALIAFNEAQTRAGAWHPVLPIFDPARSDAGPDNAFWISGLDEKGEMVACQAGRLFDWRRSSLAEEARRIPFGSAEPVGDCIIDTEQAARVRGLVYFGGATWIRPDYRLHRIGTPMAMTARAFGTSQWGVEWLMSFVQRKHVGMHEAYGYANAYFGIRFPGSPWGEMDLALLCQRNLELFAYLERFLEPRQAEAA
jgi:hypothetical protein